VPPLEEESSTAALADTDSFTGFIQRESE